LSNRQDLAMTTKWLAALTGLLLAGWLVLHVLGNFTAFSGAAALNGYAAALRQLGPLLWLVRAALVAAAVVHIAATVSLARRARAARPIRHVHRRPLGSYASRLMVVGGPLLLVFIVYHLLHITFGVVHPSFAPGDVHANLVGGLAPPLVGALYVAAAALVGLHLHHGLASALVSFGSRRAGSGVLRHLLRGLAVAIAVGFAAVPVAVLAGALR
jgi:succinate dehydrogenase / fumarate reductase cytochrome b subunit